MNEEELLSVLALQRAKGVGDIIAKKLISHCGSAQQVLKEKSRVLESINGVGSFMLRHLFKAENLKAAEKELAYLKSNKIKPLYFTDKNYPERLKHCVDGPVLLFQDGNINLEGQKIVSIVGTRKMTSYGRDFCEKLIEGLKEYDPIIVSGFAYGVDICAHKAALKNKLQTIGVIAHGFEEVYPKAHKKHVSQINENGGFLTDFWHDEKPVRENFLKRNRIVAGMSEATIIIESAEKGGSLVTADIANSYSRDVFAVPGRSTDVYSKGCNELIKTNKAALLTSANDLVQMLNWERQDVSTKIIQKQLFVELTTEEQFIYDYLLESGKQLLDMISLHCNFPIHKTTTLLFQLEMKGVVKPLPGKLFEAV